MNLATALKSEISRVARKELRGETKTLKKSSAQYRGDIATLKRRVADLEKTVRTLAKIALRGSARSAPQSPATKIRFSPQSISAQRKRLGLSASDFGSLVGVSAQSIYHWEQGKSRPRESQMPAIHAVRQMGKRDAAAQLAAR